MSDDVTVSPQTTSAPELASGLDQLMNVSADRVYREPVRVGERVVIPAAAITYAGGFGFGTDTMSNRGGGGGGWSEARPVAVVEAGPDGVKVRPVVDLTRVG
ncbi:MAG TPA: hypothetical protein VFR41_05710, partial [Acidimicrobiia bacterium]|nr:hypothetical protein [Acidimicrobiia bacterium]